MSTNSQSASLQSTPGWATRPSSRAAYAPTYPAWEKMPDVPALVGDANSPGYLQRQMLANQYGALAGRRAPILQGIRANAQQALAGYGGYQFQQDDPATPQDEGLLLDYNAANAMGQRETAAYRGAANAGNSQGMLESSFTNQNIASAIQRVSLEAQQVVNQYAASINQTLGQYSDQAASIAGQWAGLYGSDSAFLSNAADVARQAQAQTDATNAQTAAINAANAPAEPKPAAAGVLGEPGPAGNILQSGKYAGRQILWQSPGNDEPGDGRVPPGGKKVQRANGRWLILGPDPDSWSGPAAVPVAPQPAQAPQRPQGPRR